ncbi:MAG: hypothetical protein HOA17_02250 [Candidatus Melainabacteria bacterium]|jgi:hypothetical protein|nr:hypothetical protein [Candidatus Melainabacteria bacterium]
MLYNFDFSYYYKKKDKEIISSVGILILFFDLSIMASIGHLTSRQVAVSGGHGISRMVKTIGSIVAKVYNGLRTWGSATSRTQLKQLSRPAPVLNKPRVSRARKSHVAPQLQITKTGVADQALSWADRDYRKSEISSPAKPADIDRVRTNSIISKVRKSNPTRHRKVYNFF